MNHSRLLAHLASRMASHGTVGLTKQLNRTYVPVLGAMRLHPDEEYWEIERKKQLEAEKEKRSESSSDDIVSISGSEVWMPTVVSETGPPTYYLPTDFRKFQDPLQDLVSGGDTGDCGGDGGGGGVGDGGGD
jgi:hypothetical protein